MQQKVLEELTSRPNTRVFYFMDDLDLITSLDNYCDHVHYSPAVCQELAHRILQDQPILMLCLNRKKRRFADHSKPSFL